MTRRSPYHMFVRTVLAALAIGAMLATPVGAKAQGPAFYSLPELLSGDNPLGLLTATTQFRGAFGDARLKRAYETNDVGNADVSECEGSPTIIYRALDILPPLQVGGAWVLEAQANHQATILSHHRVNSLFTIGQGVGDFDEVDTEFCRQWANATDHVIYIDPSVCGDDGCHICPTLDSAHVARGEDGEDTKRGYCE